jgi:hypothetical protein
MWLKKNKWIIIGALALCAVLAFAFWYGGDSPDSRGWSVTDEAEAESESADDAAISENVDNSVIYEDTADAVPPEAAQGAETDTQSESEEAQIEEPMTAPETDKSEVTENVSTPEPEQEPALTEDTKKDTQPETVPDEETPEEITEPDTCTISISCAVLLDNTELDPEKAELVPEGGVLLSETKVELQDGDSAFDVLKRVCQNSGIHLEYSITPLYATAYIEGIGNIYEFDAGEQSGWMYKVNGSFLSFGCSKYIVAPGDKIEFVYTCDLGKDVGAG